VRFYALHLREAGLIGSTPEEMIEKGTDFRFFNELKEELAAFPALQPRRAAAFNCHLEVAPRYALGSAGSRPTSSKRDI
jgi:hypothetical protein